MQGDRQRRPTTASGIDRPHSQEEAVSRLALAMLDELRSQGYDFARQPGFGIIYAAAQSVINQVGRSGDEAAGREPAA